MKKFLCSIFRKCKKFKKKLKGKKRRIFLFFLLIWSLKVSPVKGAILPGADGFPLNPPNPPGRFWQNRGRDDLIIKIKTYTVILQDAQVQAKFEHAAVFGVPGKPCRENFKLFKEKLVDHLTDPSTIIKESTYRKVNEVRHFFNPRTGLNVMILKDNNTFLSGWKLNPEQLENFKNRGAL